MLKLCTRLNGVKGVRIGRQGSYVTIIRRRHLVSSRGKQNNNYVYFIHVNSEKTLKCHVAHEDINE